MVLARYNSSADVLIRAVRTFTKCRIIVLGDLMLDRFIWGSVHRISPEAPVPVVDIKTETTCLGGAANVSANIRSLGGIPFTLGIVGRDFEGERLRQGFISSGASVTGLVQDPGRATTVKTRIIAHHQQVCRTDREDRSPLSSETLEKVIDNFKRLLPRVSAVVVSDYAKGLISPALLREVLPLAKKAGKFVCVDPKMQNFTAYRPATIITPNTAEAERASGVTISSNRDLVRAGKKIMEKTGTRNLLVTRGEQGMALFEGTSHVTYIPTEAREVFDVTGAGDTVISTLALGLVSGLSVLEAAVVSNIAAGIVVGKLGTASATPDELISRLSEKR